MVFKQYRGQRVKALQKAESTIVRIIQQTEFSREMDCLKNNKPLDERNRITPLDPFIDTDGVLRVGGRIRKAVLSFSKKHLMILPADCHLAKIIIRYYHHNNLHTGVQNTLYALREKCWLFGGRNQVKMVIKNCVACFRANPTLCKQKMGNLPSVRIIEARVFSKVEVDYCGPFFIKTQNTKHKLH